jgi:hypothetical protein
VAIDPVTKLLVAIDVGEHTQAMAQCFVHHIAQMLAPDGAPLFVTDGFRAYLTALLTHYLKLCSQFHRNTWVHKSISRFLPHMCRHVNSTSP